MSNSVIIGERLRHIREMRGLSTAQLAKDLNIKPNTYRNYETGNRYPRADFLLDLCEYYDVEPNYIFGISDIPGSISRGTSYQDDLAELKKAENAMEVLQQYIARRPRR